MTQGKLSCTVYSFYGSFVVLLIVTTNCQSRCHYRKPRLLSSYKVSKWRSENSNPSSFALLSSVCYFIQHHTLPAIEGSWNNEDGISCPLQRTGLELTKQQRGCTGSLHSKVQTRATRKVQSRILFRIALFS